MTAPARFILAFCFGLLLCLSTAHAQFGAESTVTAVNVTSSSAGTQLATAIRYGVVVTLPSATAVPVWVARLNGTCSTALVAPRGVRLTAGNGYEFLAQEGWSGQLCAILESGSTPVEVKLNAW